MKRTVMICDRCGQEISDRHPWAVKRVGWIEDKDYLWIEYHFCDTRCLGRWANEKHKAEV